MTRKEQKNRKEIKLEKRKEANDIKVEAGQERNKWSK